MRLSAQFVAGGYRFKLSPPSILSLIVPLCLLGWGQLCAQETGAHRRVPAVIDDARRTTLRGHVHPEATAANDLGPLDPATPLSLVTITFSKTEAQAKDLQRLLAAQQDPSSPEYHQWLSPEQFAERFGLSDADLSSVQVWLEGQGLKVAGRARGRNWIAVSGTAAQLENAFRVSFHRYSVRGETHFANTTDPSVPAAMGAVVESIRGLNDFRARPLHRVPQASALRPNASRAAASRAAAQPDYTSGSDNHYLAPDDFATIYNLGPVYQAGINGAGQKIVVAGQTKVNLADIQQFRSSYGLPANDPQMVLVPNSIDPGTRSADLAEADLDLEWAGAIARNATIVYVYANDVMQAVQYAIDQKLAPVLSTSYGSCELETSSADAQAMRSWAQQGNAQGITWLAASGDSGAADCNDSRNPGLAVDMPASIPEVTAVGGTEFAEGSGAYWKSATSTSGGSAISGIPETAWNDSGPNGTPAATGGGASLLFGRPSWQTGPGVPPDNSRHIPDVAFSASADHDGYLVYSGGNLRIYGGTSVPTPAFAGMIALLNQYTGSALGNINPNLYSLAKTAPRAFRDVTTGNNVVTVQCSKRAYTCNNVAVGFNAGPGYDSVTGLGSIDAANLFTAWKGNTPLATASPTASITLLSNLSTLAVSDSVFFTATVSSTNGVTPTGSISFSAGGTALGSAPLTGSAGKATATISVSGAQLPLGATTVTAVYVPSSSGQLNASVNLTVAQTGSIGGTNPAVAGVSNAASFRQFFAPGMILAIFGSGLAPSVEQAASTPLPYAMAGVAVTVDGVSAPLFYVSPGQINIQIPYEVAPNSSSTVTVNNNGRLSSSSLWTAAAAPGIFTDGNGRIAPSPDGAAGQVTTFYLTGAGAVSPSVSTGASPPGSTALTSLPVPSQAVLVTVGGLPAAINFIGIPAGLVGVTQVNYTIPVGVRPGLQPVVVTVGGVTSAPVYLNIG